jgi:hypothetical protein
MPTGLNKDGKWVSSNSVLKDIGIPVNEPSPLPRDVSKNEDSGMFYRDLESEVDMTTSLLREADAEIKRLKSTVAWQKKTIAARDDRIRKLETAIREIIDHYDHFERDSDDEDVATMLRLTSTVMAIGRAEAILDSHQSEIKGRDENAI